MKNFLLISFFILISTFSYSQTTDGQKNGAILVFAEKVHDFGDIKQGEKVEWVFKFKNTGNQPLVISDVVTTCSCTAKQWSKEPVLPGKMGQITVSFDSTGKQGLQNKVITILSNAINSTERVSIRLNILPQ